MMNAETNEDDMRGFASLHAMMKLASALNRSQHSTPFGNKLAPTEEQDQPHVFCIPSTQEVASGAGKPSAPPLSDLVSLLNYTDASVLDLTKETSSSTVVASAERKQARQAILSDMRGVLNRILRTMYARVGGNAETLALEREPQCMPERSVGEVAQIYHAGLVSRDEARVLVGEMFGKTLD